MPATSAPPPRCAWQTPGNDTCGRVASSPCANCYLVVYCGKDCQRKHWPEHKKACKSPLSRSSWRPAWDVEARAPVWSPAPAAHNGHNPFGGNKYLWGNVPAIDVLRLEQHEGSTPEPIHLLFAASGDLRNVVHTITALPNRPMPNIHVVVNDRDLDVLGRNAILMLFVLVSLEECCDSSALASLAESLIHLWYSALLPEHLSADLKAKVHPLVVEAYQSCKGKDPALTHENTWKFGSGRSLRLNLRGEDWLRLVNFWEVPSQLSMETAMQIRAAVTKADGRRDCRDRWYFKDHSLPTRVAKERFREDGLLLPFGQARLGFTVPNPTLFRSTEAWLMNDKSDPLDGWPLWEVHRWNWPAKEDCYGKLFSYLAVKFASFSERLTTLNINFELHCTDALALSRTLGKAKFARIEVSNVADAGYLGLHDTLKHMRPLLQTTEQNRHATLIVLFLNAVTEIAIQDKSDAPDIRRIVEVLGSPDVTRIMMNPNGAEMYRIWDARAFFYDVEKLFLRYMALHHFKRTSRELDIAMKPKNTIIEPWPFRPRTGTRVSSARNDTQILLGSNLSGLEHYTEWQKESHGHTQPRTTVS